MLVDDVAGVVVVVQAEGARPRQGRLAAHTAALRVSGSAATSGGSWLLLRLLLLLLLLVLELLHEHECAIGRCGCGDHCSGVASLRVLEGLLRRRGALSQEAGLRNERHEGRGGRGYDWRWRRRRLARRHTAAAAA